MRSGANSRQGFLDLRIGTWILFFVHSGLSSFRRAGIDRLYGIILDTKNRVKYRVRLMPVAVGFVCGIFQSTQAFELTEITPPSTI